MFHEDIQTPENFLVWFHERFHYLQSNFYTHMEHLKVGSVSHNYFGYNFGMERASGQTKMQ